MNIVNTKTPKSSRILDDGEFVEKKNLFSISEEDDSTITRNPISLDNKPIEEKEIIREKELQFGSDDSQQIFVALYSAKIRNGYTIKQLVDLLACCIQEANINVTPNVIWLAAKSTERDILAEIVLRTSRFSKWTPPSESLSQGVTLDELQEITSVIKKNDSINFIGNKKKMQFKIVNTDRQRNKIRPLKLRKCKDETSYPAKYKQQPNISILASELLRSFKDDKNVSNHIRILIQEQGAQVRICRNDKAEDDLTNDFDWNDPENPFTGNDDDDWGNLVKLPEKSHKNSDIIYDKKFSRSTLAKLSKMQGLSTKNQIRIHTVEESEGNPNDFPLLFATDIDTFGECRLFVSPIKTKDLAKKKKSSKKTVEEEDE